MIAISMTLSSNEVTLTGGKGSVTVSVTNGSPAEARVVLGASPAAVDGTTAPPIPVKAEIDEPLRTIPSQGTEQYVVDFDTTTAPPGTYAVRLIAYSADEAPEDYAENAHTVTLTATAAVAPPPPRIKWWMIAAGAAVLLAIIVAVVIFLLPRDAPATDAVTVPAVVGLDRDAATLALALVGLGASTTPVESESIAGMVLTQNPVENTPVPKGSDVALEIAVPRQLVVPTLQGFLAEDAVAQLQGIGFIAQFSAQSECTRQGQDAFFFRQCFVQDQVPLPDQTAPTGSVVVLTAFLR